MIRHALYETYHASGSWGAIAGVAAGEYPMIVGPPTTDILSILERDPGAKLKMVIPTEVPVNAYFHTIIPKGCANPNAGLLLAGWMASPEGQKLFDTSARRGSPMVEGTEISKILKASGSKIYYNSWEYTAEMVASTSKEVIEAWGFPTPRKKSCWMCTAWLTPAWYASW